MPSVYNVVLDTNILLAGLRSSSGASHLLLRLLGGAGWRAHVSPALALEYEQVLKRNCTAIEMTEQEVDQFLDDFFHKAALQPVFFRWRPTLSDPKDELILELAVAAGCQYIVTHYVRHFVRSDRFGVHAIEPKDFLAMIQTEEMR
jgi:predicted nucleic acid-binding protein